MDDFLNKFRKEPRPAFAKSLYERIDKPMNSNPISRKGFISWKTALAGVAALMVVVMVASPAARAAAQDFLNLFRVKRFAAVTVDPERMKQLQNGQVGIEQLLSASAEVLKKPAEPLKVDGLQAASQAVGFAVRVPATVPDGMHLQDIIVQGEGSVRFTADVERIQSLLQTLGINDVQLPPQLDRQVVTISKPPVVMVKYAGDREIMFLQSRNPQIELPAGVNLAQLGEIALRVAGMTPQEAQQFASKIDWSSTLLVPVPANATNFREVEVRGVTGMLISTNETAVRGKPLPQIGTVLLWAEGDMVYAISGAQSTTLVEMANSIK